jgi:hypothetical protein
LLTAQSAPNVPDSTSNVTDAVAWEISEAANKTAIAVMRVVARMEGIVFAKILNAVLLELQIAAWLSPKVCCFDARLRTKRRLAEINTVIWLIKYAKECY